MITYFFFGQHETFFKNVFEITYFNIVTKQILNNLQTQSLFCIHKTTTVIYVYTYERKENPVKQMSIPLHQKSVSDIRNSTKL